jgi:hypothetical protein
MKKGIKIVLATCFSVVSILLAVTTTYRLAWHYNENGIHFEEDSMTTYHDGAIIGYGILTLIFLIPTLILLRSVRKPRIHQQRL